MQMSKDLTLALESTTRHAPNALQNQLYYTHTRQLLLLAPSLRVVVEPCETDNYLPPTI